MWQPKLHRQCWKATAFINESKAFWSCKLKHESWLSICRVNFYSQSRACAREFLNETHIQAIARTRGLVVNLCVLPNCDGVDNSDDQRILYETCSFIVTEDFETVFWYSRIRSVLSWYNPTIPRFAWFAKIGRYRPQTMPETLLIAFLDPYRSDPFAMIRNNQVIFWNHRHCRWRANPCRTFW